LCFLTKENVVTVGTRIGDSAIDLGALQQLNYFEGIELTDDMFMQELPRKTYKVHKHPN
jgi:fumarylacetoacetase